MPPIGGRPSGGAGASEAAALPTCPGACGGSSAPVPRLVGARVGAVFDVVPGGAGVPWWPALFVGIAPAEVTAGLFVPATFGPGGLEFFGVDPVIDWPRWGSPGGFWPKLFGEVPDPGWGSLGKLGWRAGGVGLVVWLTWAPGYALASVVRSRIVCRAREML